MEDYDCIKVPVTFIIFNRLDTTKEVFEQIRKVRPEKLYLISDGARDKKPGEREKVKAVREYIESNIDWNCKVSKNYAKDNMGCRDRVASGISWVLNQEEMTIILEDDCKPTDDFFYFCQENLLRYKDNEQIMMISGSNHIKGCHIKESYTFSYFSGIWGWATWKRAWDKYDADIKEWPELERQGTLKEIYNKALTYYLMQRDFNKVHGHQKDTWDHQWDFIRAANHGLGIVPSVNMIENIGFGREDATHTTGKANFDDQCGKMNFPLAHPQKIERNSLYDDLYQKEKFGAKRIYHFMLKKICKG